MNWNAETERKKSSEKLLPNCRVWARRKRIERKKKLEKCIEEIFHFAFFSHFALEQSFRRYFLCLLVCFCPCPIRTECEWLPRLLRFYFNFLFGQFSLAPYKKPLKTTEFSAKENFRTIIVRVHLVIEIFRCRFLFSFLLPSRSASSSLAYHFANCATQKALSALGGRANRIKSILINFIAVCRIWKEKRTHFNK